MIYKEYFTNSEFEDVWRTLKAYCKEPESVKDLYRTSKVFLDHNLTYWWD